MEKPLIYQTEPSFKHLLRYHGIPASDSAQPRVDGYTEYNFLVDANACFSTQPSGDIVDRSQQVNQPWRMWVHRPWQVPTTNPTLDDCFRNCVTSLTQSNKKVNLFWSGGIDSTSMLVGFLKHAPNLAQLRIIYSQNSVRENPNFYNMLVQTNIELAENIGTRYLTQNYDGIFISADGADDLTASLDDSFYEELGFDSIHKPWQDLFYQRTGNSDFVDFYQQFTQASGRTIDTVLEARWWFYTCCKIQKFPGLLAGILHDYQGIPLGFFDSYEFDHYMFYNTDKIIPNSDYVSYKQFLKDYIYEFDGNADYHKNKRKENSSALISLREKKLIFQSTTYIMLLQDGTRIRTPHLPLISEREYRQTYGDSLNYLFE
jgi:hypothetical protein